MKAFKAIGADFEVAAVADPRYKQLQEKFASDLRFAHVHLYEDAEEMLNREHIDGVFIGTRCSLHTQYACMVLERKLPLFLEKPVCISYEQYDSLLQASKGQEDRVVVSFPLRLTSIVREMRRIVESGILGTLTMVQAINNVPYGSVYYHSWYRDAKETGGLFMQKATHDVDYIRYLIGEAPDSVCAKTVKLYFKGEKPAGLRCPDCAQYKTCPESSFVVEHIWKDEVQGDACCFAVDTGNEDGASAILTTPSGLLISYNQNFVVKKSAARRGARLIGTEGSAEFDFYSSEIIENRYRTPEVVRHTFNDGGRQHFGGDEALAFDFMRVLDGGQAQSDLKAGLASAAVCLAAKEAAALGRFVPIVYEAHR